MVDFDDWYEREHPRVLAACRAVGGDVDAAAEATSEAFARAAQRWASVRTMAAPGGWVQVVALNQLRRSLRRRRVERRLLGVRFELWGRVGAEVGRTIGPSGLDAVLTTPQPVAVPGGWKTVSWGGFSASVPRGWAVTTVRRRPSNVTPRELAEASVTDRRIMEHQCDLFPRAGVYRGDPTWSCQGLSYAEVAKGLWLGKDVNPGPRATPFSTSSGATIVARWSPYAGDASLMGFTVHAGGETIQGTLLIGSDPVLAEQILSSIRATGSAGS